MSTTVDQRVVEMRFDNKNFEQNVSTSMSTLSKLKQSLRLDGATKGFEDISAAANGVNMSGLGGAVEAVSAKFSALSVIGITALANITNSAINTGKQLVKSLSIDQITAGWDKFSSKTTSVATLVAQGNELETVNEQLDRLNWFTDETSYNFTDMVSNIAKFTASGKGLEESVVAMEGIANWAALSGQNAATASRAMYQLSQAMGSGVMRKEDYKSIQNASMDTDEFRKKCLEAGVALGTLKDNGDGTYQSLVEGAKSTAFTQSQFADHLTQDMWFTSDVMMKVFTDYSSAVNAIYGVTEEKGMLASEVLDEVHTRADELKTGVMTDEEAINAAIKDLGYVTEDGALLFDAFGIKAFEAAQKARTWGDAVDSVKDAVSTGWMNTFEIIFGNAEEATQLWTDLANSMWDVFASGGEARNEMLKGWKELGGRDDLIEGFWNIWEGFFGDGDKYIGILGSIKEAFRDIFPAMTSERLASITKGFKNLTDKIKPSAETLDKLKRTFKGFFSILDMGKKIITAILKPIGQLIGSNGFASLGGFLLDVTARIGDFFTSLNEGFQTDGITGALSKVATGISDVLSGVFDSLGGFSGIFSSIGDTICTVASKIWGAVTKVFGWITDHISAGDIFAGLAGGGIFVLAKKLGSLVDKIKGILEGLFDKKKTEGIKEQISDILGSVHDSLESFTSGIKIASLVSIAIAIGILSASLNTIAKLDGKDVAKGLFAIGVMLAELSVSFRAINKALSKFNPKGLIKAGITLILLATAVRIMSSALVKLSGLSWGEIAKGLLGLGGALVELCVGLKIIDKVKIPLRTSIAILALAEACKILGDAFTKFGALSWGEIARGFVGMGGALGELVAAIAILQKYGGFKSIFGSLGILILVQGLSDLADALKKFGEMQWDEIGRGLAAMGGALTEVTGVTIAAGKIAGFSSIFGATGILIVIQGLDDLANALIKFGAMQWDEIGRGLAAMGGALVEVSGALIAVSAIAGFAGIFGAGSILIVTQGLDDIANALIKFATMQWDEIGRGLAAMGGALLEVGGISAGVGVLAGFAGIVGAGTILLAIQGLDDLANGLQKFGSMQWDEIGRGLAAMGGALVEVGAISGATGALTGFAGLVGAGTILLAVQGLDDLANALQKFGSMQWDEIIRGLTAMGIALGEVGLGSLLSTFSGFGASAIAEVAAPLGTLADSVKKWSDVTVPEGLGTQLGVLAGGISAFTYSGLGAGALSTAAPGVGIMADSVKKWSGVTLPENLGTNLSTLASGISAFTFSGFGADALATAAPGVGTMADSVKKWSGVTVPENLGTQLTDLAGGVKSFSLAFLGGWSIDAIVEPLKNLASSVKAWNGVSVPDNLKDDLDSLASGVKSFSFAFLGGWSIGAILEPLKSLASSVKAWNGVSVPAGLEDGLKSLANGIKAFNDVTASPTGVSVITKICSAATQLSSVNFSSINSGLKNLASSLKGFESIGSSISGVGDAIVNNLVNPIKRAIPTLSNVGGEIANGIVNGIKSRQSSVASAMSTMVSAASRAVKSKQGEFRSAGASFGTELVNGIRSKSSSVTSAASSTASAGARGVRGAYNSMYNAGSYLVDGVTAGINDNSYKAVNAATAMANKVAAATRKALQINSPSKVFMRIASSIPEGFGMGIDKNVDMATASATSMANSTIQNVQSAISRVGELFNADMGAQPTIKPIVDLSNVKTGVNAISDIFSSEPTVGVLANVNAISSGMNRLSQNESNADVVSAINKLSGKLNNIGNTSYNINGVTYDDGSAVSEAVGTLVRYAKIGRRV